MLISLCGVTAGGGLDWPEFVALAGRNGYDAVDVNMDVALNDGAEATNELLASHKMKPGCCGLPTEFRTDDATFERDLAKLPQYAQLAVDLGCPRMATWVPPAYDTPADEMRRTLLWRFSQIAAILADYDVKLGLEFISPSHLRESGHPCIWQMKDMLEAAISCGDNVGLLLDCWHWHHDPDHTVDAIIEAGRDRIVTVHLNDSPDLPASEIRDNERLLPGEGVIDLAGFVSALKQIGYADAVTLEVFGRLKGVDHDDAARLALEAAKLVLAD